MAKGGYQKRRIERKRLEERARRRKQRLVRKWTIMSIVVVVLLFTFLAVTPRGGGSWGFAFLARKGFFGGDGSSLAGPTPGPCTTPGSATLGKKTFSLPPCMSLAPGKTYSAALDTSLGTITVELLTEAAPETVNNFVFLARQKFYDGSIFHRVIPDFGEKGSDMIQGGDTVARNGSGDPGYKFGDENTIPFNQPGYLAMANSGPGTNGSQFFILDGPVSHLNAVGMCPGQQGCHSIFGRVRLGLDVVDKIAHVKRGEQDKPLKNVVLESVSIIES